MQPACIFLIAFALLPNVVFSKDQLNNKTNLFNTFKEIWCRHTCQNSRPPEECYAGCCQEFESNAHVFCDSTPGFENCKSRQKSEHAECLRNCPRECCVPPNSFNIPEIPTNVTVLDRGTAKKVAIHWFTIPQNDTIYYIEERHLTSCKLVLHYMRDWTPIFKAKRKNWLTAKMATFPIKPGTWYQFRVAAINRFGSLGFSEPSKPFKSNLSPKRPEMPQSLSFEPIINMKNTSEVWGILSWKKPKSVLPIRKYTVYISTRVADKNTKKEEGSTRSREKIISGDKTKLKITDLDPDSIPFFQVVAHARCGTKELLSNNASLSGSKIWEKLKNTTNPIKFVNHKRALSLKVSKVTQDDNGALSVRIMWNERPSASYAVKWQIHNTSRVSTKVVEGKDATLSDLKANEKYHVSVTEVIEGKKSRRIGTVSFLANPICNKVKSSLC